MMLLKSRAGVKDAITLPLLSVRVICVPALCVPVLTETVPCPLLTPLVIPEAPVPMKVPPEIVQEAS